MRLAICPIHLSKRLRLPRKNDARSYKLLHLSMAPATKNSSLQILFKCPTPAIVFGNAKNSHVLLTSDTVHNPLRLPRETTSERQKVVRHVVFLTFLLWNVLRATTACIFSTSQLPKVVRTWCGFCTFWLRNVLRATTACNLSSLICLAGSAPAALASLLFDLRSHKSAEKRSVSWLSYLFAHLDLLSSENFSFFFSCLLWLFPSLLFICPYCRKFDF